MKAKEVRELSPAEIEKKLRDTREELLQLRLRKKSGQVESPHLLRQLRKDIARMETILSQKNTSLATA
jgi:large subunit ribosomal protein L29